MDQTSRHMFNWELLNRGKYGGKDKSPHNSPGISVPSRKNARLESLSHNPAVFLPPVDEEDVRQQLVVGPAGAAAPALGMMQPVPRKSKKTLARIDESQLSLAARNPTIKDGVKSPSERSKAQMQSYWKVAPLNAVGKPKPIYAKQPSLKNEEE